MKFRASFSSIKDEFKGTVELPANDPALALECTVAIIERISDQYDVSVDDVIRDLWRMTRTKS